MNDPPQREAANQDVIDMLIAISVVARHLARKLEETNRKEKDNESDERTGDPAGRTATDRQIADRLRRESPANGCSHAAHILSQPAGKTVSRPNPRRRRRRSGRTGCGHCTGNAESTEAFKGFETQTRQDKRRN